ncbi:MAG: hypothetical protein AAF926_07895 [Pseudomonadota bacterium]
MLDNILKYRRWIGVIAILICIWAWSVEILGWTYICPFCRVQRTVIGLLGVMMLFPIYGHWLARYFGATFGFFGAYVAARQHFGGWRRISSGEFKWHDPIYYDSFLLAGAALFIISALVMLLWTPMIKSSEPATETP